MGWKEGKGVGVPASMNTRVKVYGCLLPGDKAELTELPPNDQSFWDFTGKSNFHGIGYSGMSQDLFSTNHHNKGVYGMSGQVWFLC